VHRTHCTVQQDGAFTIHMLEKNLIWAGALSFFLLAVLSIFMPFGQAMRMVVILYFILYLPGYFFLKNIHFNENALEQNTLSIILGIVLMSEAAYLLRLLNIPYTKTTVLICSAIIISASLLWERARQRKTRGASKRTK
jgi:uncharacterized membrane protein